jgi:hypothetical protein
MPPAMRYLGGLSHLAAVLAWGEMAIPAWKRIPAAGVSSSQANFVQGSLLSASLVPQRIRDFLCDRMGRTYRNSRSGLELRWTQQVQVITATLA